MQDSGRNDLSLHELRCFICLEPLDDGRPWRRGLDHEGAHDDCLEGLSSYDDPEEERNGG